MVEKDIHAPHVEAELHRALREALFSFLRTLDIPAHAGVSDDWIVYQIRNKLQLPEIRLSYDNDPELTVLINALVYSIHEAGGHVPGGLNLSTRRGMEELSSILWQSSVRHSRPSVHREPRLPQTSLTKRALSKTS